MTIHVGFRCMCTQIADSTPVATNVVIEDDRLTRKINFQVMAHVEIINIGERVKAENNQWNTHISISHTAYST